jgi:hypothetical protein
MDRKADRVSTEQALAIYAEALVARGVIAVLGDASAGVGALLLALGARSVYVWDPDEARALAQAEVAPRGMTIRPMVRADLVRRDFDLVVIPDLGLFTDPVGLLADVRRMVGDDGAALVAAANSEVDAVRARTPGATFDYYALFDVVAQEFDFVRMIAELPFRGVVLAELGDDADASAGVSVDSQLADEGVPPEVFVALASQRDVRLDPYVIVQLPRVALDEAAEPPPLAEREPDEGLAEALRERAAATSVLEAALEERTRQVAVLAGQVEQARASAEEARLAAADELDELIGRVDRAEHRVAHLEKELAKAETDTQGSHAADHAGLEEMLRERAQVIRGLEEELRRRDELVRELAGAIEDSTGAVAGVPGVPGVAEAKGGRAAEEAALLRVRLDALALDLARRDDEAKAAAWTVEELERRLALAEQAPTPVTPPSLADRGADAGADRKLAAALDELDTLKLALVQEHDARVKAESRLSKEPGEPGPTPEHADEVGAQPGER